MSTQDDPRLSAAADAYRARAQSTAGLVATAAAAIATGAIFGGASRLPHAGATAAIVAIVFLVLSAVVYVAASHYAVQERGSKANREENIKNIVEGISGRAKYAAWLAAIALLSFVVMVGAAVWEANAQVDVHVVLDDSAVDTVGNDLCPSAEDSVLDGTIPRYQLRSGGSSINLVPAAQECASTVDSLSLNREAIVGVLEVEG